MTSTAIAVFVKTPGLSAVKTRLAADLGTAAAEQFYRLSLKAVERTLTQAEHSLPVTAYWAVAEAEALCHPLWQQFKTLYTGPGDLGDRQHHIYQTLLGNYDQVILIGADSPQLATVQLQQTLTALENQNFVMGPAEDGGYYLFAGNKPVDLEIWRAVTYSRADTAQQLLSKLSSRAAIIDRLWDMDRVADMSGLQQQLIALPQRSEEQELILQWIKGAV